jgi:hypothetical protein
MILGTNVVNTRTGSLSSCSANRYGKSRVPLARIIGVECFTAYYNYKVDRWGCGTVLMVEAPSE